jgi:hypothetical protein
MVGNIGMKESEKWKTTGSETIGMKNLHRLEHRKPARSYCNTAAASGIREGSKTRALSGCFISYEINAEAQYSKGKELPIPPFQTVMQTSFPPFSVPPIFLWSSFDPKRGLNGGQLSSASVSMHGFYGGVWPRKRHKEYSVEQTGRALRTRAPGKDGAGGP